MATTIFRKIRGRIVPIVVDKDNGSGYVATASIKTPAHKKTHDSLNSISSYSVPNTLCQKCGKAVYYYENSSGSKVLFDALGPPWPVHPCYAPVPVTKKTDNSVNQSGWQPVIIDKGVFTTGGDLRIQGVMAGEAIRFTFPGSAVSKMKITMNDVSGLIVFGSQDEKKVQTHNGSNVFFARYQTAVLLENKVSVKKGDYAVAAQYDKGFIVDIYSEDRCMCQYLIEKDYYFKYFDSTTKFMILSRYAYNTRIDSAYSEKMGAHINLLGISKTVIRGSSEICPGGDRRGSHLSVSGFSFSAMTVFTDDAGLRSALLRVGGYDNYHKNYIITAESAHYAILDEIDETCAYEESMVCLKLNIDDQLFLSPPICYGKPDVLFPMTKMAKRDAETLLRRLSSDDEVLERYKRFRKKSKPFKYKNVSARA